MRSEVLWSSHLQSNFPKVKCAGSSCGAVFHRQGLSDSSELIKSSMHQNIEIALLMN